MKLETVVSVVLAAALATGCAAEVDDEESLGEVSSPLATTTKINVGDGSTAYDRYSKTDAAVTDFRLYMNAADLSTNAIFGAYTYSSKVSACAIRWFDPNCASLPPLTVYDDEYQR